MRAVFGQIWMLARLCIAGPGGWIGVVQFLAIFGLGLLGVQVSVRLIAWTADFYNALQKLDVEATLRQIAVFFGLIAISVSLFLAGSYLRKMLQIRWRRRLTDAAIERWLSGKAYWHLRERTDQGLDNPDQRIAEDCRIFVDKLTGEAIELATNIVALVSYVAILWSLSTFALSFTVFGHAVEIPRYMVWAAPLYVALASGATHLLGRPLKALAVEQQRREADFRFALTRLREHVEAVALSGGEPAERRLLARRFGAVARNWRSLANRELVLGVFIRPYFQTVLRIPLFLALPAYLAGRVSFGGLMQIGSAFQNVVTTMSWFIFSYRDLVELAAASSRLSHFMRAAAVEASRQTGPLHIGSGDRLNVSGLALSTPGGRPLLRVPELALEPGTAYWVRAPSGYGKSTLAKALAGLWRHGEGRIERPSGNLLVLPQQPYLPLGTLRSALAYPQPPENLSDDALRQALAAFGLREPVSPDDEAGWADMRASLSGGEKQRLALARAALQRPGWLLLDEATSALDAQAEEAVLKALRTALPATTLIVVAHRRPAGLGRMETITLDPRMPQDGANDRSPIPNTA